MPKITEDQLSALRALPYLDKIRDFVELYELGIFTQEKFNDEIVKARLNHKSESVQVHEQEIESESLSEITKIDNTFPSGYIHNYSCLYFFRNKS